MTKDRPLKIIEISSMDLEGDSYSIPLYASVQAGFASPAEEAPVERLDLNRLLVKHPAATFFVRVEGDSMKNAHIISGDILIVDRAIEPTNGKIIVAILNGEFTVKRLILQGDKVILQPENPKFPPIHITQETDFQVWGVVTYALHKTL